MRNRQSGSIYPAQLMVPEFISASEFRLRRIESRLDKASVFSEYDNYVNYKYQNWIKFLKNRFHSISLSNYNNRLSLEQNEALKELAKSGTEFCDSILLPIQTDHREIISFFEDFNNLLNLNFASQQVEAKLALSNLSMRANTISQNTHLSNSTRFMCVVGALFGALTLCVSLAVFGIGGAALASYTADKCLFLATFALAPTGTLLGTLGIFYAGAAVANSLSKNAKNLEKSLDKFIDVYR